MNDDVFDCNVKFIIIYYIINNEKINEIIEIIYINWSIIIWNKKKQFIFNKLFKSKFIMIIKLKKYYKIFKNKIQYISIIMQIKIY